MRKIKKAAALAAAFAMALSLSACGSSSSDNTASAGENAASGEASAEGDTIEINFFHRWPNDPKNTMFKELVARYEEENPNVKINMDCILNDQYKEKIRMMRFRIFSHPGPEALPRR